MAWNFPKDVPFDMRTKNAYYGNCRLVEVDTDHVTVDYECKADVVVGGQAKLDDVEELVYRAPLDAEMQHAQEKRASATR